MNKSVIHSFTTLCFFFSFTNDHGHCSKSAGIPKVCTVFPCMHMLEFISFKSYIGTIAMPFISFCCVFFFFTKAMGNNYICLKYLTLSESNCVGEIFVELSFQVQSKCSTHLIEDFRNSIEIKLTLCYTRKPG